MADVKACLRGVQVFLFSAFLWLSASSLSAQNTALVSISPAPIQGVLPVVDGVHIQADPLGLPAESAFSSMLQLPVGTQNLAETSVAAGPNLGRPTAIGQQSVVSSILSELNRKGLHFPSKLRTSGDIRAFRDAVSALPEGSSRSKLLAFADVLSKRGGEAAVSVLFDESGARDVGGRMPESEAPEAQGFLAVLEQLPLIGGMVKDKVEEDRVKAEPLPEAMFRVDPAELRWDPDLKSLPENTAVLPALDVPAPGQKKALDAVRFGASMPGNEYNILVTGPEGSGRSTAVRRILAEFAAKRPTPPDLAVLSYTDDLRGQPLFLRLPPGSAPGLNDAFTAFFEQFVKQLPAALNEGKTEEDKQALNKRFETENAARHAKFDEELAKIHFGPKNVYGIGAQRDQFGVNLFPTENGFPLSQAQVDQLMGEKPELWAKIDKELNERSAWVSESYRELDVQDQKFKKELDAALIGLEDETAARLVETLSEPMLVSLRQQAEQTAFASQYAIGEIRSFFRHVASQYRRFLPLEEVPEVRPIYEYAFSVLTTHAPGSGAPVVFEAAPSFPSLFGFAEPKPSIGPEGSIRFGGTDLLRFVGGSFLRASGGYLVVRLEDLFMADVWPDLISALRSGSTNIVQHGDFLDGTQRMPRKAHAVPADVKVVLIGSPMLAHLVAEVDENLGAFFRAGARFESSVKVSDENIQGYVKALKSMIAAGKGELLDLSQGALTEVLRYAAWRSGADKEFSSELGELRALVKEASLSARAAGRSSVEQADVAEALRARRERAGGLQNYVVENFVKGFEFLATAGAVSGQVNGLAVIENAEESVGTPMRVTVVALPGTGEVVAADRDAHMTGQLFDKALGIARSALRKLLGSGPLPDISVSFEQSYGPIDGDSATSTVIYAALSALSGVPIKQGIAVTGSADQFGNIQAVGGVAEKISGFFALAKARGLDGAQGVIIPAANVRGLMLDKEVVDAVREGKFHIWAVEHVAQGMEILTGEAYSEIRLKAQRNSVELAGQ
ncbi:MAG: AAA family ATPase [Elusimicrobiota bacterium]